MNQFLDSFNSREVASLVWLAVFLVWLLGKNRELRSSLKGVARAFSSPAVVSPFIALGLWSSLLVWWFAHKGLWDASLLKDTLLWFLAAGALLFRSVREGERPGFFRSTAIELFAASVVLQFAVNAYVMAFWQEMLFLPFVFVVVMSGEVAKHKPELAPVSRLFLNVSAAIGLALLAHSAWRIYQEPKDFFTLDNLKTFLLEPLLTLWSLPVVALFVLLLAYERLFRLVGFTLDEKRNLIRYAKFAVVRGCNLSIRKTRKLDGAFSNELSFAKRREDVRWVVSKYLDAERSPYVGPETIEVYRVRVVPWINPMGIEQRMVLVDWKNVGKEPINAVYATISPYDSEGKPIDDVASDYTIYADFDGAIAVGQTYVEPKGEGFILSTVWGVPESAKVEITRAKRPVASLESRHRETHLSPHLDDKVCL